MQIEFEYYHSKFVAFIELDHMKTLLLEDNLPLQFAIRN